MKALVAIGCAAMMASAGSVQAKLLPVKIKLDDLCDKFAITIQQPHVSLYSDVPDCETAIGVGEIGNMRQFGKSVAIGVVFNGDPGAIYVVQLTYPFVTGGTYQISLTVDGAGYDTIAAGTYTVLGKDEHAPPGGGPRLTSLRH